MVDEMMRAAMLGLLQGATEFLPVSSSGHLVIVPALLGWPDQDLTFDVVVHLATACAVLLYFRTDWARLALGGLRGVRQGRPWRDPDGRLLMLLVLATLPGVAAGLLFEEQFERLFAAPKAAAIMLFVTGALLVAAELIARHARGTDTLGIPGAIAIGVAQAMAIVPGISRSGATIAAGLGLGLRREEAARFSFLLAAPIIVGAAGLKVLAMVMAGPSTDTIAPLLVGFVTAFAVGYAAIDVLLAWVRRAPLHAFALYTWLFGAFALWRLA